MLPVTVWLAGPEAPAGMAAAGAPVDGDHELVGLTVSSVLMSQGAPAMLAGLINPASDLADLLEAGPGRFAVHVLDGSHKRLAQHFAGELPAPREMLATRRSAHGPLLDAVGDRVLCHAVSTKPFGWSLLVEAEVDDVEVGPPGKGLAWWRGNFYTLP